MDEFAVIMDGARIATRSFEEEVSALKQQLDKDILVGSLSLIAAATEHKLVDEYQLCVHPMIAGKGLPLYKHQRYNLSEAYKDQKKRSVLAHCKNLIGCLCTKNISITFDAPIRWNMEVKKENKLETVNRLKQDLLRWQGVALPESHTERVGLGPVEEAFPGAVFPPFGVHEFISESREESAATSGFMGGLLSRLIGSNGVCLWISTSKLLFPPSVSAFGVAPDRVIFVDIARERDVLWATEEALKYSGLTAVVAELQEMDFVQSRRLQLAVEKSRVSGLILRCNPRVVGSTACAARWRIRSLPSVLEEGLPGVGFPRWKIDLLKVRNGNPGCWQLEWSEGRFVPVMSAEQARGRFSQMQKIS